MSETIKISNWSFVPETGVLQRGDEFNRLEIRAAALLELLAHREGGLVSHEDIIENIWDGRAVSPNSVAVVISNIRRALGDDSRDPQYIETLPKRGYRLIADITLPDRVTSTVNHLQSPGKSGGFHPGLIAVSIAGFLAVALFVMWLNISSKPGPVMVHLTPTENQTGDTQYDPLTISVTELLAVELTRHEMFQVSPDPDASVIISGTLILWDGHPSMSVHAISAADGRTLWSGMAKGPETLLPRQVRQEISELAEFAHENGLRGSES